MCQMGNEWSKRSETELLVQTFIKGNISEEEKRGRKERRDFYSERRNRN